MSPTGVQRTIAVIIFISPWVYVPMPLKEVVFIVAGVLLFISTLDVKRAPKHKDANQHEGGSVSQEAQTAHPPHHHPSVPSI